MSIKFKKIVAFFTAVIITAVSVFSVTASTDYLIIHQPTTKEPYVAVTNASSASYQWYKADDVQSENIGTPVNGQNTDKLTSTPDGEEYICKISWANGTELTSDAVTNVYAITHQPSAKQPYVLLNNHSEVEFQWYKTDYETKTLVTENTGDNEVAISYHWSGNYSDGIWSGDSATPVDIEFELEKNQILTIIPSEGFSGTVEEYGESFLIENNGIYTYLAEDDKSFNLCIEDTQDFSAEIKIITFTSSAPVQGQTANKLTSNADGNYYFCEISGNNTAKLYTSMFRYDCAVTHQPTSEEPYVEINSSEKATYTWYEVTENKYKIVDTVTNKNERQLTKIWSGSYSSGKWQSNQSGTFEGLMQIRKGQTVIIDLPHNFQGGIGGLSSENGSYLYTAETNEKFYIYLKNAEPFEFSIYLTEFENKDSVPEADRNSFSLPVDGKYYRCEISVNGLTLLSETFKNTYTIIHQPTENESYVETNDTDSKIYQWYRVEKKLYTVVDKVTQDNELCASHIYSGAYSDSAWLSDKGKIDIELNLKKDDILMVRPSDNFDGSVSEYDGNNLSMFDGVHTFIANRDGLFDLYVFSKKNNLPFSASVQILRGTKGTVLNSRNDSTLDPVSNGEYMCTVNYSDGTVIDSESVVISNGTLEKLENELKNFSEKTVSGNDLADITNIVKTAKELQPTDNGELVRINSVIGKASALIGIITEITNQINEIESVVDSYNINKVIPSDKTDLIGLKSEIAELKSSTNITQEQKDTLSKLLVKCNELIEKIENSDTTVSIINNPKEKQIDYGQTIVLRAVVTDIPYGSKIIWYVNDSVAGEGENFEFSPEESSMISVKITDESGNIITDKNGNEISDSEQIIVKTNFFIKIINFFKKLFRINQTIIQSVI